MSYTISKLSTYVFTNALRFARNSIAVVGVFAMAACKIPGSSEKTEEAPPPPPPVEAPEPAVNTMQGVAAPEPSASAPATAASDAPSAHVPGRGPLLAGAPAVTGGQVSNAQAVVAGMSAGFRRCYNRGLQENPEMKGSLRITARIGRTGEVASAAPAGGQGLSDTVIRCLVSRVESAQFAPPEGGGATIVIPVTLVQQ